jgi:hypothetical protein
MDFGLDVELIRSTLDTILSQGTDVVMVYHSYGGACGAEALAPHVEDLKNGVQKEGWGTVKRLIYCCAFSLPLGGSLMAELRFKDLPWFIVEVPANIQYSRNYRIEGRGKEALKKKANTHALG